MAEYSFGDEQVNISGGKDSSFFECEFSDFMQEMKSNMMNGEIRPYHFEPLGSDYISGSRYNCTDSLSSDSSDSNSWNISTSSDDDEGEHCLCKKCNYHDKNSICCRSLKALDEKLNGIKCITKNKNFISVCIDTEILKTAYATHISLSTNKESGPVIFTNKIFCDTAIKQFQMWVYKAYNKSGNDIPSCVLKLFNLKFFPETASNVANAVSQLTPSVNGFVVASERSNETTSFNISNNLATEDFTAVVRVNKSGSTISSCLLEYVKDEITEDTDHFSTLDDQEDFISNTNIIIKQELTKS